MGSLASLFAPLQAAIMRKNQEDGFDASHPWYHKLTVNELDGLLDVDYRGEDEPWFGDNSKATIFYELLRLLGSTEVAPNLWSFTYRTDASIAANGTYSIIIDPLLAEDRPLTRLSRFILDQGPGEHGYKILASARNGGDGWFEEAGVLADLLVQAPALKELVTPSPPSGEFFQGRSHPLRSLDVDSGFGHENFIRHLAGSSRFPELRQLVFTDDRNWYLDDWHKRTTSYEDYVTFFGSPVAARLESICLRDVNLTVDQIHRLREMRGEGLEITVAQ